MKIIGNRLSEEEDRLSELEKKVFLNVSDRKK